MERTGPYVPSMKGCVVYWMQLLYVPLSVCLGQQVEDWPYTAKELNVLIANVVYNSLSLYFIILYSI